MHSWKASPMADPPPCLRHRRRGALGLEPFGGRSAQQCVLKGPVAGHSPGFWQILDIRMNGCWATNKLVLGEEKLQGLESLRLLGGFGEGFSCGSATWVLGQATFINCTCFSPAALCVLSVLLRFSQSRSQQHLCGSTDNRAVRLF